MIKKIKSNQNHKVKIWNKLKTKKGRIKFNSYILEGWHLVQEALQSNQLLDEILMTEDFYSQHINDINDFSNIITFISDDVSKHIASTITPQGIFAIAKLPNNQLNANEYIKGDWLLLDQIQDPGNIGTMVRTADAAGMQGVVFGKGTTSRFNPKTLRSMQGSQFHLKLIDGDINRWIDQFKFNNIPIYGSELNVNALDYRQIKPSKHFALIMGNEGNGMQKHLLNQTTKNLYIPIKGKAESLNVAIASGILMFQLNQRS